MAENTLEAHLRLALAPGLGPVLIHRLIDALGSPDAVARASVKQLEQADGIGRARARNIHAALREVDLDEQWRLIERHRVRLLPIEDPAYPRLLRHIHDPPPLLFVRGELRPEDALALAVVGSRKCTLYGREQADRLAAACASTGLSIVSGGARGIDAAAHRAALRLGGRTVAVLGCGLARTYPPEHGELFDAVAERGALISELPMNAPPIAEHFPRRNRIISGLSLGVLVVEAALRSGALITARLAAEEHHREVLAVPGRIDSPASAGCHKILREGWATLVTSGTEILDALGEAGQTLRAAAEQADVSGPAAHAAGNGSPEDDAEPAGDPVAVAGLSEAQRRLLDAISADPVDLDRLVRDTGLPIAEIQSHLTLLQLRGLVDRVSGNQLRRRPT